MLPSKSADNLSGKGNDSDFDRNEDDDAVDRDFRKTNKLDSGSDLALDVYNSEIPMTPMGDKVHSWILEYGLGTGFPMDKVFL